MLKYCHVSVYFIKNTLGLNMCFMEHCTHFYEGKHSYNFK